MSDIDDPPDKPPELPGKPVTQEPSAAALAKRLARKRDKVGRPIHIASYLQTPKEKVTLSQHVVLPLANKTARDLIASYTGDGEEIVRFMFNAMQGEVKGIQGRARIAAAEWLGVYLFGKPVETTLQMSMSRAQGALPNIPDEQLEAMARKLFPEDIIEAKVVEEGGLDEPEEDDK